MQDLEELTAAEEIFLRRLRRRAANGRLLGRSGPNQSQTEAAEELGISQSSYSRLELGDAAMLTAEQIRRLQRKVFTGPLRPSLAELCLIARRRSGLGLAAIERGVGVSRPLFHRLERSGDDRIVTFWRDRGFRFPGGSRRTRGGYSARYAEKEAAAP